MNDGKSLKSHKSAKSQKTPLSGAVKQINSD